VMISKRNLGEKFLLVETHHLFPALFLVILIIAVVSYVWYQTGGLNMVLSENVSDLPTVKQIGISFIIKYLLPFELAGLLLLIALIGASVIAGGLYHKNTAENKKK
jgi:NADH:ubiquinone oxidoreductase subunit 6 (subunit J)